MAKTPLRDDLEILQCVSDETKAEEWSQTPLWSLVEVSVPKMQMLSPVRRRR